MSRARAELVNIKVCWDQIFLYNMFIMFPLSTVVLRLLLRQTLSKVLRSSNSFLLHNWYLLSNKINMTFRSLKLLVFLPWQAPILEPDRASWRAWALLRLNKILSINHATSATGRTALCLCILLYIYYLEVNLGKANTSFVIFKKVPDTFYIRTFGWRLIFFLLFVLTREAKWEREIKIQS